MAKQFSDEKLKRKLSPEQYAILREKGTEAPFTGKYFYNQNEGMYVCPVCGSELFSSQTKYDSHIPGLDGWPSFADVVSEGAIKLLKDDSLGMQRTEVVCATCGSHLGHLFDDNTSPTGQHYCINSASLEFQPKKN